MRTGVFTAQQHVSDHVYEYHADQVEKAIVYDLQREVWLRISSHGIRQLPTVTIQFSPIREQGTSAPGHRCFSVAALVMLNDAREARVGELVIEAALPFSASNETTIEVIEEPPPWRVDEALDPTCRVARSVRQFRRSRIAVSGPPTRLVTAWERVA